MCKDFRQGIVEKSFMTRCPFLVLGRFKGLSFIHDSALNPLILPILFLAGHFSFAGSV